MGEFIQYLIDFVFPPSEHEVKLRSLSPEGLFELALPSTPTEFPFIRSLFSYKDPLVRELVWQIKYKKNKHAIQCAGYALHRYLSLYAEKSTILVPIPLSKKRKKERGYNQCEVLIDEILKQDTTKRFSKSVNLLVRSRHIEKQTLKNRKDRIENTKAVFKVLKKPSGMTDIIIIDDVSTTGSTLKEAYEALRAFGYENVKALTVAH